MNIHKTQSIYSDVSNMAYNFSKHIALEFNCGFARTAVRELTPIGRWKATSDDLTKRALDFQQLFNDCENYGVQASYFDANGKKGSKFDQECEKILKIWGKRWNPTTCRQQYLDTFSTQRWKEMTVKQKDKHTLQKCNACLKSYKDLQMAFPQGPYHDVEIVSINTEALDIIGKKEGTQKVLREINSSLSEIFDASFTDALVQCGKAGLQKKVSKGEKKRARRSIYRNCRDQENAALKRSSAIATLVEDDSLRSYQRKCKQQYFEPTPPAKRSKPTKSHSPNFDNITWDKEKLLQDLQQLPPAPPPLNWQKFAREHGITGGNAGQVAKEFARKSGVNTERLDGRSTDTPHQRVRRRKLLGGEISAPCTPTSDEVRSEWKKLVEGEISLSSPCVLYMVKYTAKDGELDRTEVTVVGRKFPLLEVRKNLLSKHEKYMRLSTDTEIDSMTFTDLCSFFAKFNHPVTTETLSELQHTAKTFQRTRSLIMWHDHGTILGLGCIILTVHVAYDPAVFYTQEEYEALHGESPLIQSLVERPMIHLFAAGSSAVDDQLTLIQDRIDCMIYQSV